MTSQPVDLDDPMWDAIHSGEVAMVLPLEFVMTNTANMKRLAYDLLCQAAKAQVWGTPNEDAPILARQAAELLLAVIEWQQETEPF